jgi:hypothetical protein
VFLAVQAEKVGAILGGQAADFTRHGNGSVDQK